MAYERVRDKSTLDAAFYIGLAADTKPTTGVYPGDVFYELDTGKSWMFSRNTNTATGNGWWEV